MINILIFIINIYQKYISPIIGGKLVCRFTPSCSEYSKQALKKYGILKGLYLSFKRIIRCNPLGGFGYDPVPWLKVLLC